MTRCIFVEVSDEPLKPARPYTRPGGETVTIPAKQTVYLHTGAKYPVKSEVAIADGTSPYRPGYYLLGGDCLSSGDYDRLRFDDRNIVLVELADALKQLQDVAKSGAQVAA